MGETILKTNQLTKIYKKQPVLHDVSIELKEGRIYGLIGENGAGKSTLMKIISGISFQTEGSFELFGKSSDKEIQQQRKRIASMIEQPAISPDMTAKGNLKYHRYMRGIPNEELEDEILQLVGLTGTNNKKAKHFSLGMKQRLGIAIALLTNPELLILDEPVNGLDPQGVVEIRQLLTRLCEERQMTILISSHNLPELYLTTTDYIIIHKGKIMKQMTQQQLDEECRHYIRIGCTAPEQCVHVLEAVLKTQNFQVMPNKTIKLYDFLEDLGDVSTALFENGITLTEFSLQGDTLENYFLTLIGGEQHV
ncbi:MULTISPECIES: ABC transporter ATP-binding protein [unclassified Lysinibacillus]|uniref:ABC transporter ATP-binding protein n=1 Tax=unclassified Lysinibacillus TaxID=2636778 RepID=UPI0020139F1B|nr:MULTISPECIES: ABC transporter ATP-binding protein [unclassified Lysinibacillus]MCL1696157.1 ABC transporter ATP-binding protein [Lysinibacillus sp. BPa_S21]MCL1700468.1 ABC transporter ATP-binding protein [Lysinibacillus sp. Bpr_S20]